jgi:hypothetical protein
MGLDLAANLIGGIGWLALAKSNPLLPAIDHVVPDLDPPVVLAA